MKVELLKHLPSIYAVLLLFILYTVLIGFTGNCSDLHGYKEFILDMFISPLANSFLASRSVRLYEETAFALSRKMQL